MNRIMVVIKKNIHKISFSNYSFIVSANIGAKNMDKTFSCEML